MAKELSPAFVDEVKTGLSRRDPVQRRLTIASYEVDDSRDHFFAAMKAVAPHMREVLASIMAHGPDADDPGASIGLRAQAAYWLLSGSNAGCWTATPQETETAHILIAIGGFALPEKMKADLAREAGLPTVDMVIVKPLQKPVAKPRGGTSRKAKIAKMLRDDSDDPISRYVAIHQAGARMQAVLNDPAATDSDKIDAVNRYWRTVDRLAPVEAAAAFWDALKTVLADYKATATTKEKTYD